MPHDTQKLAENMQRIAEQSAKLTTQFWQRQWKDMPSGPIDPMHVGKAFSELYACYLQDPAKAMEAGNRFWQEQMGLWQATTQKMLGQQADPLIEPEKTDRRFKDEAWEENAVFDHIKQSYLLTSRWVHHQIHDMDMLDEHARKKLDFYAHQYVDAMSPSNFVMTNPQVLKETFETDGENLVKGLEHMLKDLQKSSSHFKVSMTDDDAFEVGKNLAITKGEVIYQNDLMQLIQYHPTTDKTYQTPLLIMPAWINKYYILDLQEKNSLVKWLVDQGYTVFMISWVNPNETHVEKSFDDYLLEGPLAAIGAIEKATGEKQVAMMGYCLGGTMTAITQAWLKAKGKGNRIVSATYLTTMIDYGDAGDLSVFIDEEQLSDLEKQMQGKGYLDAGVMANTFSLLRANDLIWSFVVNNYLLGREPFPFDILYWNSDSTRMPAKMQSYYLRNMYQHNRLKDSGALTIGGVKIDLATIEAPAYLLSTQEDHIAPWQSIYEATDIFSGDVTFVLAGSGHVSGVVNAPAKNRYGYHINPELTEGANAWLTSAHYHEGSWWGHWHRWQQPLMGKKVKAHKPAQSIEAAPGSYVKVRT